MTDKSGETKPKFTLQRVTLVGGRLELNCGREGYEVQTFHQTLSIQATVVDFANDEIHELFHLFRCHERRVELDMRVLMQDSLDFTHDPGCRLVHDGWSHLSWLEGLRLSWRLLLLLLRSRRGRLGSLRDGNESGLRLWKIVRTHIRGSSIGPRHWGSGQR